MAIGIDPLVDYAFKMLFGRTDHKMLTISLINTVLDGQPPVTDVTFPNTIHNKLSADGKYVILDVLAEDVLGRKFNIEVQIALPAGMAERMALYTAETWIRGLREGQNYDELRPSISICVVAGALIKDPAKLHLDFRLREKTLPLTLTDHLQIHFLQLNHLQVTADTLYNAAPVERWCWFLRHAQDLTTEQLAVLMPDKEFTEAAKVLDMIAQTPEQLQEYNARLKAQRDEEARIIFGRQQGLEIGEARGIEIGEARGIRRGLLQGQVVLLQQLLRLPVSTDEQLAAFDLDQLNHMLTQLQQQFSHRDA
ncbi:MAG: Rpn family recombination-promoting nuclease/putative transposase [Planctomycetaceae bacterium]